MPLNKLENLDNLFGIEGKKAFSNYLCMLLIFNFRYVVSTSKYPIFSLNNSNVPLSPTTVEEPQVSIGIFPSTHIRIRQMLPDAEGRLSSIYSSYQSTAKQFPQRATSA